MKTLIPLFILGGLIISCGSKNEKANTEKAEQEQKKIQEELKEKEKLNILVELTVKYNIPYKLDTIEFHYSIDYKPILESKHILIDDFNVNDIFEKDSLYFVSIQTFGTIDELILPISKAQVQIFSNEYLDKILVVHLKEIKKIKFEYEGEQEGESVYVGLGNSTGFSSKGELIEIVSLKE